MAHGKIQFTRKSSQPVLGKKKDRGGMEFYILLKWQSATTGVLEGGSFFPEKKTEVVVPENGGGVKALKATKKKMKM